MLRQKERGIWREWSWEECAAVVGDLAAALARVGLRAGDGVCIVANASRHWVLSDLGSLTAGAVVGGVYPHDSAERLKDHCASTRTRILFVEDEEQLDKVLTIRHALPEILKVIVFRTTGLRGLADDDIISWDQLLAIGRQWRSEHRDAVSQLLERVVPNAPAAVLQTSGSSSESRNVVHTHESVVAACRIHATAFSSAAGGADRVAFLPPCHVMERIGGVYASLLMGHVLNFVEQPETMLENLREVQPVVFMAIPRVWEKLYSDALISMRESTTLQRTASTLALKVGGRVAQERGEGRTAGIALRLLHALARGLALNSMRRAMGMHRLQVGVCAFAPIAPDLVRWFASVGVDLREGYGLTECGGLVTLAPPAASPASVGVPLAGVEVKVSPEGEVLIMSPSGAISSYEAGNAIHATSGGWLRTGDCGVLGQDGFLRLQGRMEDRIVTSNGRSIQSSAWENRLKLSPFVMDAVIVGDGRPYPTCLVLIDQDNVEQWAQRHHIAYSDFATLCRSSEVRELIGAEVEEANSGFDDADRVRSFALIEQQLGPEDEELAATMKLRRRIVHARFHEAIDAMYRDTTTGSDPQGV